MDSTGVLLRVQPEAETIQVFLLQDRDSVSTHHVSKEGICLSEENVHTIMEFPIPETYTEVRAFSGLSGHYRCFIRNFAHLAHALYDLLGDEIKMGPVTLTPEAEEAV